MNDDLIDSIKEFIVSMGYEVLSIKRKFHNISAVIEKNKKKKFFKITNYLTDIVYVDNEIAWYRMVAKLRDEIRLDVKVPEVYEIGRFNNMNWCIREYIDGEEIFKQTDTVPFDKIVQNIPLFINTLKAFSKIYTTQLLPADLRMEEYSKRYMEWMYYWNQRSHQDELYEYAKNKKYIKRKSFSHGDFVPWHFLESECGVYIYDSENGNVKAIKHYDAVYFFEQVFTKVDMMSAEKFLSAYLEAFPFDQIDKDIFYVTLAKSLMRAYENSLTDPLIKINRINVLRDKILNNSLI